MNEIKAFDTRAVAFGYERLEQELAPYEQRNEEIYNRVKKPRKLFRFIHKVVLYLVAAFAIFTTIMYTKEELNLGKVSFMTALTFGLFHSLFNGLIVYGLFRLINRYVRRAVLAVTDSKARKMLETNIPSPIKTDVVQSWRRYIPGIVAFDTDKKVLYFQNNSSSYTPVFVHVEDILNAKISEYITTESTGKIEKGFFSDSVKTTTRTTSEEYFLEVHYQKPGSSPECETFYFADNRQKADQFLACMSRAMNS